MADPIDDALWDLLGPMAEPVRRDQPASMREHLSEEEVGDLQDLDEVIWGTMSYLRQSADVPEAEERREILEAEGPIIAELLDRDPDEHGELPLLLRRYLLFAELARFHVMSRLDAKLAPLSPAQPEDQPEDQPDDQPEE